jgi:hypothetical protein
LKLQRIDGDPKDLRLENYPDFRHPRDELGLDIAVDIARLIPHKETDHYKQEHDQQTGRTD